MFFFLRLFHIVMLNFSRNRFFEFFFQQTPYRRHCCSSNYFRTIGTANFCREEYVNSSNVILSLQTRRLPINSTSGSSMKRQFFYFRYFYLIIKKIFRSRFLHRRRRCHLALNDDKEFEAFFKLKSIWIFYNLYNNLFQLSMEKFYVHVGLFCIATSSRETDFV